MAVEAAKPPALLNPAASSSALAGLGGAGIGGVAWIWGGLGMAASAVFTRLARAELGDLVAAAVDDDPQAFAAFLAANGTSVADFDEDGEIFSALLPILSEEYDIDLETSENEVVADLAEASEALVFILTVEDQVKYLGKLNPDNFSEAELAEAYEDFTEEEDDGAGELMLAAIGALHQALMEVDADHVVVVTVG